jgi:hypothetical protein
VLAIILSPSRCRPVKDEHLWCGDHAISRGVLGLSFQGPRGAGLPTAGSRYLVPVVSGVQRFFGTLRLFFSFGIPIEKRSSQLHFQGLLSCLRKLPVRLDWVPIFAACRDGRRRGPPSREGVYGLSPETRQVLSILSDRFFNLIHTLWISRAGFLLIGSLRPDHRSPRMGADRRPETSFGDGQSRRVIDEPDPERLADEEDLGARGEPRQVAKLAVG